MSVLYSAHLHRCIITAESQTFGKSLGGEHHKRIYLQYPLLERPVLEYAQSFVDFSEYFCGRRKPYNFMTDPLKYGGFKDAKCCRVRIQNTLSKGILGKGDPLKGAGRFPQIFSLWVFFSEITCTNQP